MILERWFEEVWNKGNEAAIDELLAPDVIIHNLLDGNGEKVSDVPSYRPNSCAPRCVKSWTLDLFTTGDLSHNVSSARELVKFLINSNHIAEN